VKVAQGFHERSRLRMGIAPNIDPVEGYLSIKRHLSILLSVTSAQSVDWVEHRFESGVP